MHRKGLFTLNFTAGFFLAADFNIFFSHAPFQASSVSTMLMSVANTSFRFRSKAETVAAVEEVLNLMADLHIKPSKKALSVFLRNGSISRDAMLEIVILLVLYGASVANENGSLLVAAFQGIVHS